MKNLFSLLVLAFACFFASGCGNGDGDMTTPGRCDAALFNDEVAPKYNVLLEAATAYLNDPSDANCEQYKSAGDAWLVAILAYEDCASIYTQDWREAVAEARAELAAESCD